jgi:glycosyltransferase involved in cell wall biosynthesis
MADRTRVLIVTDEMEVGGTQRQIVHLLSALDRARWEPALMFFRNRSFLVDRLEAAGVPISYVPKRSRLDLRFIGALAAQLRHGRYDIIQCFSLTAELWVRALLPFLPRTAFVASIRGLFHVYTPRQWQIKQWILRRCSLAIANTHAGAKETSARTGFPLDRIAVIPNGVAIPEPVDDASLAQARAELDPPGSRSIALFVGRLVVEKNLPLLLDALADMPAAKRPVLLVAGSGELESELKAHARARDLERDVRWLGERRDTLQLMRLADVLVLPSLEEGLSNVLLEAMSAGCAVLASNAGGNVELIDDGRTGLLFPSGSRADLVDALTRLGTDVALRARLADAARQEILLRYAIPSMVAATEAAWLRAMDKRE